MGPAPDKNRRRRNAAIAPTIKLPAEGVAAAAPRFPLGEDLVTAAKLSVARAQVHALESKRDSGEDFNEDRLERLQERVAVLTAVVAGQRKAELALWREVWKLPQAAAWDRHGYVREVAKYVRLTVLAESGDLASGKEARQWSDRLGLNDLALLRLRWEVSTDEVAHQRATHPTPVPEAEPTTARPRPRAVDPGAVAGA